MLKNDYLMERAQCQIDSLTECSFRRIFFCGKNILFLRLLYQKTIRILRLFFRKSIIFLCLFGQKIILEVTYSIVLPFLFSDYSIQELIWFWGFSGSEPILGEEHSVKALFGPYLLCHASQRFRTLINNPTTIVSPRKTGSHFVQTILQNLGCEICAGLKEGYK